MDTHKQADTLANSEDPNENSYNAAFDQNLDDTAAIFELDWLQSLNFFSSMCHFIYLELV